MTETTLLPVKVGDFFVESWGYDQTNITFYKVVGLTAKSVKVQEWTQKVSEGEGTYDMVVPGDKPRQNSHWSMNEDGETTFITEDTPVKTKRLLYRGSAVPYIKTRDWGSWGHLWSGEPQYQTNSLYGH